MDLEGGSVRLHSEIIAYRATKRCVLRIRTDSTEPNRSVFLKVFRRSLSDAHLSQLRTIAAELQAHTAGQVRVPLLLDTLPAEKILITAGVCDSSEIIQAGPEDLHSAAQAMAALHQITSRVDNTHSPDDEILIGRRWYRTLRLLSSPQYRRLGAIFDQLSERLPRYEPQDTVLIHRDFYGRQLLRTDDTVWIVDLASALRMRPGGLAHRLLFRLVQAADRSALLKWKRILDVGDYTDEERAFLRRHARWRALWPFDPKRGKKRTGVPR